MTYKWPFLKCKLFYNEMNFLIKKRLNILRFSGSKVIGRSTSLLQHLSRSQRNWRTITSHEKTGNVNHIFAQKSKFGFYLKIGRNKGLFFQSSKRNTFWRSFFIGFKKTSELFICRPQKLRIKNRFFLFRNASHSNKFGSTSTRDFFLNLKNQNYVSAQRTHVESFLSFQFFLNFTIFPETWMESKLKNKNFNVFKN